MTRLGVSGAVRLIYVSLGVKRLIGSNYDSIFVSTQHTTITGTSFNVFYLQSVLRRELFYVSLSL